MFFLMKAFIVFLLFFIFVVLDFLLPSSALIYFFFFLLCISLIFVSSFFLFLSLFSSSLLLRSLLRSVVVRVLDLSRASRGARDIGAAGGHDVLRVFLRAAKSLRGRRRAVLGPAPSGEHTRPPAVTSSIRQPPKLRCSWDRHLSSS